jgi:hypothetical protein
VSYLKDGLPASFMSLSAVSLAWWVHYDAELALRGDGQKWAQLIDTASRRAIQAEMDAESRITYRDAALEAIALARKTQALPEYYCTRRELRLRTVFMRIGAWGKEWLQAEGETVFTVFVAAMPADIEFFRNNMANWGNVDDEIIAKVQIAKQLFKYLDEARPYLGVAGGELADRWLPQVHNLPKGNSRQACGVPELVQSI